MNISFGNISRNRQSLMGIAGLFIIFCHNSLYLPHWFYAVNFSYLRFLFQVGVDMFLLFSGLGCYFSLSKSKSSGEFYKKRITRLLPSYLIFYVIIIIVYLFIDKENILQKMYSYSPFSFPISEDVTLWFIPAILFLYLVSPFIFRIFKKINNLPFLFIGIMAIYIIAIVSKIFSLRFSDIFLLRVPSFLFGMLIGYCEKEGKIKNFKTKDTVVLFSVFIISLASYFLIEKFTVISRVVFFPLCVSSTTIIASLIRDKSTKVLRFLGTITLETYLFHVPILSVTDYFSYRHIPNDLVATWFSNICAALIAVFLAFAINKLVKTMFYKSNQKEPITTKNS